MRISASPAVDDGQARFAVVFDTVHEVTTGPVKPQSKKGIRHWWSNRRAQTEWHHEYAKWVAAGRPARKVTYRYYMPHASISLDQEPVTVPDDWQELGYVREDA